MDFVLKVLAVYALIGVCISVVGGAWRPLDEGRTNAVRWLQILFLVVLWLPSLVHLFIKRGRVA